MRSTKLIKTAVLIFEKEDKKTLCMVGDFSCADVFDMFAFHSLAGS